MECLYSIWHGYLYNACFQDLLSYVHTFWETKKSCFDYLLFPNSMPNDIFLKHVGELCLGNIFSTLDLLHTYTIHFYVRLLVVRWVFSNHITMVVNLFAYNLFSENACFIAHHKFKYHTVQHRQQAACTFLIHFLCKKSQIWQSYLAISSAINWICPKSYLLFYLKLNTNLKLILHWKPIKQNSKQKMRLAVLKKFSFARMMHDTISTSLA